MKKSILKHRFLYLFLIFGLTLSYTSCKDEEEEPSCETFLECNDGTKWYYSDEELYIRINDNTNNPFDNWGDFDDTVECYEFEHSYDIFDSMEVIENSKEKLIFTATFNSIILSYTFTIQGETLKIVLDQEGEISTFNFDKTSLNVDNFEICD